MHEISIVRQVTKTVMDYAAENNITEISEIVLQIGELSMIVPQYVEEVYPLVVKDTMLADTKLKMEMIYIMIQKIMKLYLYQKMDI